MKIIITLAALLILAGGAAGLVWLAYCYKQVMR